MVLSGRPHVPIGNLRHHPSTVNSRLMEERYYTTCCVKNWKRCKLAGTSHMSRRCRAVNSSIESMNTLVIFFTDASHEMSDSGSRTCREHLRMTYGNGAPAHSLQGYPPMNVLCFGNRRHALLVVNVPPNVSRSLSPGFENVDRMHFITCMLFCSERRTGVGKDRKHRMDRCGYHFV